MGAAAARRDGLREGSRLSAGDQPRGFSLALADAYFIGISRWAVYHRVVARGQYPKLQRLIDRLEADPAVIFAHAIEDERPAVSNGGFRGHISLEELRPRLAA